MKKELKYYGLHACLEIWKKRPQDLIRVYLNEALVKELGPLLKWCAQQKKAYHIVPEEDLSKVSDSIHHEGVCILAKEPDAPTYEELLASLAKGPACILYLDGVQNPHNLGSILRTAAHFSIPWILGEKGKLPALSPSACRIAKGAAEMVKLLALERPLHALQALQKKGFSILATSSHEGTSLHRFTFPPKTILAIGAESDGVSKPFLKVASELLSIPGSGLVESLNVSVASALCIGEYCRQHSR